MAFTHTIEVNWKGAGREILSSNNYSADAQGPSIDVDVPDSTTDKPVSFAIDKSQIKAIFMLASVDMLVETNSSSAPTDSINLKAGKPYIWFTGSLDTNLITADVTAMFLTTGSVGAGTFQVEVVYDSTT